MSVSYTHLVNQSKTAQVFLRGPSVSAKSTLLDGVPDRSGLLTLSLLLHSCVKSRPDPIFKKWHEC